MDSACPPSNEIADLPDSFYPDGKITQLAVSDLKHLSEKKQPFFLAVGYYRPHLPFTPPKKYWDLYNRSKLDTASNPYLPKNGLGFTDWNELRRYGDIPQEGPLTSEKALELLHGYYASVSFSDAQIGILLQELDALGLEENTIVVVCGDHGWNLGEHGLWCKHTNYEISNRTVLMFKVPGGKKNMKTAALSGLIDIYPTLCDLTGIKAPKTVTGVSLKPILTEEREKVQDRIFSFYGEGYSMRTNRYRFTRYRNPQKIWESTISDTVGFYELYDHKLDPSENFNIAYDENNQELLKELEKQMDESLKRQNTDYVDILYLHAPPSKAATLNEEMLNGLRKAKEQGKARFIGLSTHSNQTELIDAALESKLYDVVLTGYNFKQDNIVKSAIAKASAAGLGVIAMKVFAGNYEDKNLAKPINKKAALKWVLNDENIHTAIITIKNFEDLELCKQMMTDIEMNDQEVKDLQASCQTPGLYCLGCEACKLQCPQKLPIPDLMRAYMYTYGYKDVSKARVLLDRLSINEKPCENCSTCVVKCTKGFDVVDRINDISRLKNIPAEFLA